MNGRRFVWRVALAAALWLLPQAAGAQTADSLLAQARERDQAVRLRMVELMRVANTEGYSDAVVDSLVALSAEMERVDAENIALVTRLFREGCERQFGEEEWGAVWLIVDHAPLEAQRRFLPLMKRAARQGTLLPDRVATLCDRIALNAGRAQRYGTQSYEVTQEGRPVIYVWPVRNARRLEVRRRAVGLSDMAAYVELLGETSGAEVVWDPRLTVRRLRQIEEAATPIVY